MPRPKKNNADYFSHDNSMRNHRKIRALRTEFGLEGFAAYVMLLETLTEADNFQVELSKELDWKLLAGDFGIDSDKLKEIFKLIEELELITNKGGIISCDSLNERLQPVIDKRLNNRKDTESKERDDNGRFLPQIDHTPGVSVAETPQSKVNETKVKKDIYIADKSAIDKPVKENEVNVNIGLKDLYKNLGMPKKPKRVVQLWQDEANNALLYFKDTIGKESSIFKCFKENNQKAKIAFSDTKELGQNSVYYFLKVYNELIKK